jgi:hypothetical protein
VVEVPACILSDSRPPLSCACTLRADTAEPPLYLLHAALRL